MLWEIARGACVTVLHQQDSLTVPVMTFAWMFFKFSIKGGVSSLITGNLKLSSIWMLIWLPDNACCPFGRSLVTGSLIKNFQSSKQSWCQIGGSWQIICLFIKKLLLVVVGKSFVSLSRDSTKANTVDVSPHNFCSRVQCSVHSVQLGRQVSGSDSALAIMGIGR